MGLELAKPKNRFFFQIFDKFHDWNSVFVSNSIDYHYFSSEAILSKKKTFVKTGEKHIHNPFYGFACSLKIVVWHVTIGLWLKIYLDSTQNWFLGPGTAPKGLNSSIQ